MNYKNSAIGLIALTQSIAAQAQTSVAIFSVLDQGVRYSDGLGLSATSSPSAAATSTSAISNGVDRSGRFGLTGTEDLGDGYKALFNLESDLYLNIGSTNPNLGTDKNTAAATANKYFEREASFGLSTPYGKVLFGRQQGVIRDNIDDIDAINGRFTGFNPNLQYTALNSTALVTSAATYYGTGDPGNGSMMRQDNALKYVAEVGSVRGTLLYAFGGVTGNSAASSSAQASLRYNDGLLLLAAAYETLHNPSDTLKLTAYAAGGRLTLGDWKIAANYGRNSADNTATTDIKTTISSIGTTYAVTSAIDLTLGYYNVERNWTNSVKPDAKIDRVIAFAEYKFSARTLTYLEYDYNKWGGDKTQFQGGAANRDTTFGFTIGLNHKI